MFESIRLTDSMMMMMIITLIIITIIIVVINFVVVILKTGLFFYIREQNKTCSGNYYKVYNCYWLFCGWPVYNALWTQPKDIYENYFIHLKAEFIYTTNIKTR